MIESNFQIDELIHEKGKQYGHPRRFFRQFAKDLSGMFDRHVSPQQACVVMLKFKVNRLFNDPDNVDTQQDIQGYLKILEMLNAFAKDKP